MKKPGRALLRVLALLALGTVTASAEAGQGGLQPYQMVRSLQLVQDRIAGGDHAALPMQRKLLELTDARFRAARNDDFSDRRNIYALMIYAMSGGNPSTVADRLARLQMDEGDRAAGAGILGYLTGDIAQARAALATIDPEQQPHEVSAFLSLVKGSVTALDDAPAGLALLDRARLLGPGTLVEEAALRRTVSLTIASGDSARFVSAAEQYARRFLRSPYSSQFAESFVSGIIELKDKLDLGRVENTIAWMSAEQARTIYLRLARRAAIDGDTELLAFASRKAREYPGSGTEESDTRNELYSSISSVTSETVDEVLTQLREMDASRLSVRDRALLEAARTVATEVVAPVGARRASISASSQLDGGDVADTDSLVTAARARLEAVDRLLQETDQ